MSNFEFSLPHYKALIFGEIKFASVVGLLTIVVGLGLGISSKISGYKIVRLVPNPIEAPVPMPSTSPFVPDPQKWEPVKEEFKPSDAIASSVSTKPKLHINDYGFLLEDWTQMASGARMNSTTPAITGGWLSTAGGWALVDPKARRYFFDLDALDVYSLMIERARLTNIVLSNLSRAPLTSVYRSYESAADEITRSQAQGRTVYVAPPYWYTIGAASVNQMAIK